MDCVFIKTRTTKKMKTYEKNLKEKIDSEKKDFLVISNFEFVCKEDADKEFNRFNKKSKYLLCNEYKISEHKKYLEKGRPEKSKIGLYTISSNHMEEYTAEEILNFIKFKARLRDVLDF